MCGSAAPSMSFSAAGTRGGLMDGCGCIVACEVVDWLADPAGITTIRLMAPEDRPAMFRDMVAAAFCCDPGTITTFCKVRPTPAEVYV